MWSGRGVPRTPASFGNRDRPADVEERGGRPWQREKDESGVRLRSLLLAPPTPAHLSGSRSPRFVGPRSQRLLCPHRPAVPVHLGRTHAGLPRRHRHRHGQDRQGRARRRSHGLARRPHPRHASGARATRRESARMGAGALGRARTSNQRIMGPSGGRNQGNGRNPASGRLSRRDRLAQTGFRASAGPEAAGSPRGRMGLSGQGRHIRYASRTGTVQEGTACRRRPAMPTWTATSSPE